MKPYYSQKLPVAEVFTEIAEEFPQLQWHLQSALKTPPKDILELEQERDELRIDVEDAYAQITALEEEIEKLGAP